MSELRTYDYAHEGVALKGQLALPAGPGPHPGVLVFHDARGLGEQARTSARLLADMGYAALATDLYGGGVFFKNPKDIGGETIAAMMTNPTLLRSRVVSAFETFHALPQVDARRIGAIGYCLGGHCVLELARSGADIRAVASFHGTLKTASPARKGDVKAKLLVMTGALDPYAPPADVAALQAEMSAAGADLHLTSYSDGLHAFTDPNAGEMVGVPGIQYDPLLAQLSWAQASAFLDAVVKA